MDAPSLTLDGVSITRADTVRYLGVTVDSTLSYRAHTVAVCAKVKKSVCALHRTFKRCVSVSVLCTLFKVLLRVSLLYCCETTYPTFACDRLRLERTQKFACRLLLGDFRQTSSYDGLLSELRMQALWRTVFTRRLCLIHFYVTAHRHCPADLLTLAHTHNPHLSTRKNHKNSILIPCCKRVSPFIASSFAYNSLPPTIVTLSPSKFKTAISNDSVFNDVCLKLFNTKYDFVTLNYT